MCVEVSLRSGSWSVSPSVALWQGSNLSPRSVSLSSYKSHLGPIYFKLLLPDLGLDLKRHLML